MKRLLTVFVVVAVMAAMVAVMAAPAFAAVHSLEANPNSKSQGTTNAQASSLVKHNGPLVSQQAQSGERSNKVHNCNAQPDPTQCG